MSMLQALAKWVARDAIDVLDNIGDKIGTTPPENAVKLVRKGRVRFVARENAPIAIQHNEPLHVATPPPAKAEPWYEGKKAKRRRNLISRLRERDGDCCFFCLREMTVQQMTLEHLLAEHKGGVDNIANLVLAHKACNEDAGHASLLEKIKIREWALLSRDWPAT